MVNSLQEYLFGSGGVFAKPAGLAARVSERPNSKYTNRKSLEALLSQIIRMQKPIPLELENEILAIIHSTSRDLTDQQKTSQLFRNLCDLHNTNVREARKRLSTPIDKKPLVEYASDANANEQFCILNETIFQHSSPLSPIMDIQAAALRFIGGDDTDDLRFRCGSTLFGLEGSELRVDEIKDRLWDASGSHLNFTYVVPSPSVACQVWERYLAIICMSEAKATGIRSYTPELMGRISKKIADSPFLESLKVYAIEGPWNAICGVPVIAICPRASSNMSIFALVNDTAVRLADDEMFMWRSLVFNMRGRLLKDGKRVRWSDAAEVATSNLLLGTKT